MKGRKPKPGQPRRSVGKGIKKKRGLAGNAVQYITRNQALNRLQARAGSA